MHYGILNGKNININTIGSSFLETGFRYGLVVFETMNIKRFSENHFKAMFIEEHLDRLKKSASSLGLKCDLTTSNLLCYIKKVCDMNSIKNDFIIRIYIYGKGKAFGETHYNTLIYAVNKDKSQKNYKLYIPQSPKILDNYLKPEIKCTAHYARNQIAMLEKPLNYDEILNYDSERNILEASRANIFFIKNSNIYTPKNNILQGITRQNILKLLKTDTNYKVHIKNINLDEVKLFDEAFLCSTTIDIQPITKINNTQFDKNINTKNIRELWEKYVDKYTDLYSFERSILYE
ncbi:hypothetical protein GH131_10400 [Staphylococcus pseudintermedius]|nr:hypothetical protein [Staphylococcus pseudintermedius]